MMNKMNSSQTSWAIGWRSIPPFCTSAEKTRDGDGGGDDASLSAMEVRLRTEDGREMTEEWRGKEK